MYGKFEEVRGSSRKFEEVRGSSRKFEEVLNFFLIKYIFNFKLNIFAKSKKGIGPIVATTLLLLVAVSSVSMFSGWFQTYQSDLFSQIESTASLNSVSLEYLEPNSLYVKNSNSFNLSVTELKIGNNICTSAVNISINSKDTQKLDLGSCTSGLSVGAYTVVLITKNGIFSETMLLKSIYTGDFSALFNIGVCDVGYTRLFGIESLTDSHGEIFSASNYTYNSCVKHNLFTLGNLCSGNFQRLFYLDGVSNAHFYTTNTSVYESNWNEVCISSSAGTITTSISTTSPSTGSLCIGSIEGVNDVNGAHMGDCSAYINKLWLKIE